MVVFVWWYVYAVWGVCVCDMCMAWCGMCVLHINLWSCSSSVTILSFAAGSLTGVLALGELVSAHQGTACLCLPSVRLTGMNTKPCLLYRLWG